MRDAQPSPLRRSEVRYARVGDEHLAYRVITGTGARDVVLLNAGTISMESLFDDPVALRLLEGLADLGRLVVFDRRGIGLSDPPSDHAVAVTTLWQADLEAVVAAATLARPVLVSARGAAPMAILYADRHPDAVSAIVLHEPYGARTDRELIRAQIAGDVDSVSLWCPSRADEPGFREWFLHAGQVGASPLLAARAYPEMNDQEKRDIDEAASRMRLPTLILRRPAHVLSPPRESDPITALVPGAQRVDLPGEDLLIFGGEVDALLAEITYFITGTHRVPEPERTLAAVLFSDLVASTEVAATLGDMRWKRLLDRHDMTARSCVARRGGAVLKTTGDGALATFPSVHNALCAAHDLRLALREEGLSVRIGIHVGDIDRRPHDISGLGVVIAARITNLANPNEILVSSTAVQTALGEPHDFMPRGEHRLRGVPGAWQLFALAVPAAGVDPLPPA